MDNGQAVVKQMTPALSEDQETKLLTLQVNMPRDKQFSWLQLGDAKTKVKTVLDNKFLEAQATIVKYDTMEIKALQEAIAKYKKQAKELIDIRKGYTKYMDNITDQMMSVEKEAADWDVLKKAEARYLKLREDAEKITSEVSAKTAELNKYKIHVANQYIRLETQYKSELEKKIADEYIKAISEELTEDGLKDKTIILENSLYNVKVIEPIKFSSTIPEGYKLLNTVEELGAAAGTIVKPDFKNIVSQYVLKMKEKFNMYWSDRANADAAKTFIKDQAQEAENKLRVTEENTKAVNQLVNSSSSSLTFSDIKPVSRKRVIVIKNDFAFAHKIISEFMLRIDSCKPRLKVKDWSNLKVSQMAAALQEEVSEIPGIEYLEEKK